MKTLRLLSFAAGISMLLAGCTGPKGDTGPAGANGNANVIDHTYSVSMSNWTYVGSPYYYWYTQWTDADVSQSILNTGSVETFVSYNSGTSWNMVPYTEVLSSTLTGIWTVNAALNTMQINYSYSDATAHSDPNTEYGVPAIWFKVVCIAGPVMKKHPNTNWHNYAEVKAIEDQEGATIIK